MDKRNVDIVIVRMDKIGDLVLSLPVDEHPAFLGYRVQWFVCAGLKFIPEQAAPKRAAIEFKRRFSPFEFWRMYQWLKEQRPQTIVLLHNPWWVSMAAWVAGVPERMGRQSQWHSFLFLNLPIRQKRSASDRHESDYNFDLVESGFIRLGVIRTAFLDLFKRSFLRLFPPNPFATLAARGLKSRGYRVVHPGMGGSALNWPVEHFRQLIEELATEMPVVVTGTKADRKYLEPLRPLEGNDQVYWFVDDLSTAELLDILSQAKSVVAPSTGVLHLAASLGTAALGIYSPRKVEHPRRWGPKGLHVSSITPEVAEADLIQPRVMAQVSVEKVKSSLNDLENSNGNLSAQTASHV